MKNFALASLTLLWRESTRFFRQKNRIVGAIGTPLVFWILIGSGIGKSFQAPTAAGDISYLNYFFPGTLLLVLLFTAIFSTISIIEDRREGFLQGVLVSPIPRSAFVLGKLMGGSALALFQGLLFLALLPILGLSPSASNFFYAVLILFLMSFGLTGLGFIFAWRLDSTQGFHAIMNLFLMPLWLLSGALFPLEGAPAWLQKVMLVNPLSYAISGLHKGLLGHTVAAPALSSPLVCLGVCFVFAGFMFFASVGAARQKRRS